MIRGIILIVLLTWTFVIGQGFPTPEVLVMQPFTSEWDLKYRSERVGDVRQKDGTTRCIIYVIAPATLEEDCFQPSCNLQGATLQIQVKYSCADSGTPALVPVQLTWDSEFTFNQVLFNGRSLSITEDPFRVTQPAPVFSQYYGDTINLVDIHGIRKGTWLTFDADSNIVWEVVYHQNDIATGFYRTYDDSGSLASRSFYVLGHVLYARKLKEDTPYSEEFWDIATQLPGFEKAECQFSAGGMLRRVKLYFYGGQIRVIE